MFDSNCDSYWPFELGLDFCSNHCIPTPHLCDHYCTFRKKDILLGDIALFFKYLERLGRLDPTCCSSFISVILEIKDHLCFNNFQPISLIGCLYKIICKGPLVSALMSYNPHMLKAFTSLMTLLL
uniref:Uncharacterized protein n=1 Tax=Lactuca sativa TaxID=4236 RepID=A0A9R1WCL6_LACSA|nr:hypothetical protein LSAT_V11C200085640 [Lactuca sativa]